MRILFCSTAGTGHFGPLVPVADACASADHQVAVAAPASLAPVVAAAGFSHLPFADVQRERLGEFFGNVFGQSRADANRMVLGRLFAGLSAEAALPGLTEIVISWRPDVVVRETFEFGSLIAAERAGLPQIQVAIGMGRLGRRVKDLFTDGLAELTAAAGLPEGRGIELVQETGVLTSVPACLDAGSVDLDSSPPPAGSVDEQQWVWRYRYGSPPPTGSLPEPWGDQDHPLVYLSYGTVTGRITPLTGAYAETLRVLADLPVRVLVTTGRGFDRSSLGAVPGNIRVEEWWPQADVMGAASAVIGHGGFGTTMTAIAAGLPQVMVPFLAFDQTIHARRVAAAHAGIHLEGGPDAIAKLPAALDQLLADPSYRAGAEAVAAEIAALPDVASCVPIIEGLAQ